MSNSKDTLYFICPLEENSNKSKVELESLKINIEHNGCASFNYGDKNLNVYSYQLAFIFSIDRLLVVNKETKDKIEIETEVFFNTYKKAFEKGSEFFKTDYSIHPNTLYGENGKLFIKDLISNYSSPINNETTKGWAFVKEYTPKILSHQIIDKFGYYSGIISEADKFIKKHSQLFSSLAEKLPTNNDDNSSTLFSRRLVSNLYELCNDKQFENIKEDELYKALNYPKDHGYLLKIKLSEKIRTYFFIHKLYKSITDLNKKQNWLTEILEILKIDKETFQSKYKDVESNTASKKNKSFTENLDDILPNKE